MATGVFAYFLCDKKKKEEISREQFLLQVYSNDIILWNPKVDEKSQF